MKPRGGRHPLIELLIDVRRRKGITQVQLSKMMGYDRSRICQYELGTTSPTLRFLEVWAQALGCSIHGSEIR